MCEDCIHYSEGSLHRDGSIVTHCDVFGVLYFNTNNYHKGYSNCEAFKLRNYEMKYPIKIYVKILKQCLNIINNYPPFISLINSENLELAESSESKAFEYERTINVDDNIFIMKNILTKTINSITDYVIHVAENDNNCSIIRFYVSGDDKLTIRVNTESAPNTFDLKQKWLDNVY